MTTALTLATGTGNVEATELLLSSGARINEDIGNYTALGASVVNDQYAVTSLLVGHGADVNLDPSMFSSVVQNLDVMKVLVFGGARGSTIQKALQSAVSLDSGFETTIFLLEQGANANGAVHGYSSFNHLWESDSDSDEDSIEESTYTSFEGLQQDVPENPPELPLICALTGVLEPDKTRSLRTLDLLLRAGADVNRVGECSYSHAYDNKWHKLDDSTFEQNWKRLTTALMTAAYSGDTDAIKMLFERGANINLTIKKWGNALTSAVQSEGYELNTTEVVETLIFLVKLGAETRFCKPKYEARIRQVLSMPVERRKSIQALQEIIGLREQWRDHEKSFHERRELLEQLLHNGADLEMCCAQDQHRIQEFLGWSDQELDKKDRVWYKKRIWNEESEKSLLV